MKRNNISQLILIMLLAFSVFLVGCSNSKQAVVKDMDISGIYTGTITYTATKNSLLGKVEEKQMLFRMNEDGTVSLNDNAKGTYSKDTGEFYYISDSKPGSVTMTISLKFSLEEGIVTAKGTQNFDSTSEGTTQEVAYDLKKTAEISELDDIIQQNKDKLIKDNLDE